MRLAFIGTDLPTASRGGGLVLHRLLSGNEAEVSILTPETHALPWPGPVHRLRRGWLYQRWRHSRFGERLYRRELVTGCDLPALAASRVLREERPDAIVTVAYGGLFNAARRLAQSLQLPLVSIFHDWWPDFVELHADAPRGLRSEFDRGFARLYAESAAAFCISPEMIAQLGSHQCVKVLYPTAGPILAASASPVRQPAGSLVAYAGLAIGMYAESFVSLVEAAGSFPDVRLLVFGPGLPQSLASNPPGNLQFRGMLARSDFETELSAAAALLVVLPFDQANRRLAQTSFSSKFSDYCRFGRPIVIWGPEDAAIVRFAQRESAALTITTPDAAEVWRQTRAILADSARCAALAAGALRVHCEFFDVSRIRAVFFGTLAERVIGSARGS